MTTDVDRHIQALRDALVAEHQAHIADVQKRADAAAARGDEFYRKWHQDDVARLRAKAYPWESPAAGSTAAETGRIMTTGVDSHVQALRDLLVADHEAQIADVQQRADDAATRGDEWYRKWHQDHVDRMKAMAYPWENQPSGNTASME